MQCQTSQPKFQRKSIITETKKWKSSSNGHKRLDSQSRGIPDPGVPGSKPLGGFKVNSALYPSEVDQLSTRNSWELNGKRSPHSCIVALRQLNPIYKFFYIYLQEQWMLGMCIIIKAWGKTLKLSMCDIINWPQSCSAIFYVVFCMLNP